MSHTTLKGHICTSSSCLENKCNNLEKRDLSSGEMRFEAKALFLYILKDISNNHCYPTL